ncbi:MAG: hypothetical protein V1827_00105 [Candidatus Micrarchaeota archaeon]
MNDDELLSLSCAGVIVLAILILVLFFAFGMKPYSYKKKKEGQNTCLSIMAKRNLSKVTVIARFGSEEIRFERKRIRKDQSVDFVFPQSDKKIKLVVETDPGNERTIEV